MAGERPSRPAPAGPGPGSQPEPLAGQRAASGPGLGCHGTWQGPDSEAARAPSGLESASCAHFKPGLPSVLHWLVVVAVLAVLGPVRRLCGFAFGPDGCRLLPRKLRRRLMRDSPGPLRIGPAAGNTGVSRCAAPPAAGRAEPSDAEARCAARGQCPGTELTVATRASSPLFVVQPGKNGARAFLLPWASHAARSLASARTVAMRKEEDGPGLSCQWAARVQAGGWYRKCRGSTAQYSRCHCAERSSATSARRRTTRATTGRGSARRAGLRARAPAALAARRRSPARAERFRARVSVCVCVCVCASVCVCV